MYFRNIANVHTVSVDFLHILEYMGVEARIYQYDKSESSHFFYFPNINQFKTDAQWDISEQ